MKIPFEISTTVQRHLKSQERITQPGMAVNMAKALSFVRQNPLNEELLVYGSVNPEIHNKIDLRMLTSLQKLRLLSSLREENSKQRNKLREKENKAQEVLKLRELDKLERDVTEKVKKSLNKKSETE